MAQQKAKRFLAIVMIVVGGLELVDGAYALYRQRGQAQATTSRLVFNFSLGASLLALGGATLKSTGDAEQHRDDTDQAGSGPAPNRKDI